MSDNDNGKDSGKHWITPQITVLVRNNPEEAILSGCKMFTRSGGPGDIDDGCPTSGDNCPDCYTETYS